MLLISSFVLLGSVKEFDFPMKHLQSRFYFGNKFSSSAFTCWCFSSCFAHQCWKRRRTACHFNALAGHWTLLLMVVIFFLCVGVERHLGVIPLLVRGLHFCQLQENSLRGAASSLWGWTIWGATLTHTRMHYFDYAYVMLLCFWTFLLPPPPHSLLHSWTLFWRPTWLPSGCSRASRRSCPACRLKTRTGSD